MHHASTSLVDARISDSDPDPDRTVRSNYTIFSTVRRTAQCFTPWTHPSFHVGC